MPDRNSRQRRIWLQVHLVNGENEVVALGAEFERIVARDFEAIVKNLLIISEQGKGAGCGKGREKESQKSRGKFHNYWYENVKGSLIKGEEEV